MVLDVPAPATKKPTDDQFWTIKNEKPNVEFLKQHFALEGRRVANASDIHLGLYSDILEFSLGL
jgi:hypothetical protein